MNITMDTLCLSGMNNMELANNQQYDDTAATEFSDCLQGMMDENTAPTLTNTHMVADILPQAPEATEIEIQAIGFNNFAVSGNTLPDRENPLEDAPALAWNEDDLEESVNNAITNIYPQVLPVMNIIQNEATISHEPELLVADNVDPQMDSPRIDNEVVLNDPLLRNPNPLVEDQTALMGDFKFTSFATDISFKNSAFYKKLVSLDNTAIESSANFQSNLIENKFDNEKKNFLTLDKNNEPVIFETKSTQNLPVVEDPILLKNNVYELEPDILTNPSIIPLAQPNTSTMVSSPFKMLSESQPTFFNQPLHMDKSDWPSEFSERIVWMQGNNLTAAKVHVHPQELGSIDFQIQVKDGITHILMNAEQKPVQEMLEQTIPTLVNLLQEGGLKPENIIISHSNTPLNTHLGSQKQDQPTYREQPSYQEEISLFEENMQIVGTSEIRPREKQRIIDYYA